jgi:hypothetical protein
MSVEGQDEREQAAWLALTNDPAAYTSTRPREVFGHGYRRALVEAERETNRRIEALEYPLQLLDRAEKAEARERELEAQLAVERERLETAEDATLGADGWVSRAVKAEARVAVLVEQIKNLPQRCTIYSDLGDQGQLKRTLERFSESMLAAAETDEGVGDQ